MRNDEHNWLGMLLVGLAGLALAPSAKGQIVEFEPPPIAMYENGEPAYDGAASSEAPALGRGRTWLLTARQGERMPLWRAWRRGAAANHSNDSLPADRDEGATRPWFRGQFLARSRAAIERMRESGGRNPSARPAEDTPELDIDVGLPTEDFASAGFAETPPSDSPYGSPEFGGPAFGREFRPQGTGVAGGIPRPGAAAPQLPLAPPDVPGDAPELNIEIDAPIPPDAAGQRSVLAPGLFPRGR